MYGLLILLVLVLVGVFVYHRWSTERTITLQERLFRGDTFEEETGAEILYEPRCRHLGSMIEGTRMPYLLQNAHYRGEGELRVMTRVIRFKALFGPETLDIPCARIRGCHVRVVRRWGVPRNVVVVRWVRANRMLVTQFLLPPTTARRFVSAISSIAKK